MREPLLYKIIRPLLYVYFRLSYNAKVINKEEIPKKGRVVLAGNHTHNLDCFLTGYSTSRCVRFVAKDELMQGFKGIFFKAMGIIPVNRKIRDLSVIPACTKYLEKEAIIVIFPEGTINKTDNLIMPFKKGAAQMAIDTGSPIVPFAITGTYHKNKIQIKFGKLYYPQSNDAIKETKILESKVIKLLKDKD